MTSERSGLDDAGERPVTGIEVLVLAIDDGHGAAHVAIPAALVREVARVDRVTPYPGAPDDVPGVAAVHGQIVSVLDLVSGAAGERSVVLLAVGTRALALAGGSPLRVARAVLEAAPPRLGPSSAIGLWSGRLLPLAATVRLLGASRHDAAEDSVLPLLDAAALIDDVVDDSDGER